MIDIHNHILPEIDDGSHSLEESAKMLSIAVREGIREIIVTPHYEVGMDEEWQKKYQIAFQKLQDYIEKENIPIRIYSGNEILYSQSVVSALEEKQVCTMNNTQYVLVEFPLQTGFLSIRRAVANLVYAGYWPILAHIERYEALRNISNVEELVSMGAYMQVNASVVAGNRGWVLQRFCYQLLKKECLHIVATDAHSCRQRAPRIQESMKYISKKMGKKCCDTVFVDNPKNVIKGVRIGG